MSTTICATCCTTYTKTNLLIFKRLKWELNDSGLMWAIVHLQPISINESLKGLSLDGFQLEAPSSIM